MIRRAFVWGSNGNDAFGRLKYAEADARRVAELLGGPRYGFAVVTAEANTDRYDLLRHLGGVANSCEEHDSLLIYFSGHGDILGGKLHLVLDGSEPDQNETYLPVTLLLEMFRECRASHRLLILDCCHAGAAGDKSGGVPVDELGLQTKTEVILYASRRMEKAREFEHLKGSFLAHAMCQFLETTQSSTPKLRDLVDHLRREAAAHNNRKDHVGRAVPIPYLSGTQQGDFPFTVPLPSTPSTEYGGDAKPEQGAPLIRTPKPSMLSRVGLLLRRTFGSRQSRPKQAGVMALVGLVLVSSFAGLYPFIVNSTRQRIFTPSWYLQRGIEAYKQRRYDEAFELFTKAKELDRSLSAAEFYLGIEELDRRHNESRGVEHLSLVPLDDEHYVDALRTLAMHYDRRGNYRELETTTERLLMKNHDDVIGRIMQFHVLTHRNDWAALEVHCHVNIDLFRIRTGSPTIDYEHGVQWRGVYGRESNALTMQLPIPDLMYIPLVLFVSFLSLGRFATERNESRAASSYYERAMSVPLPVMVPEGETLDIDPGYRPDSPERPSGDASGASVAMSFPELEYTEGGRAYTLKWAPLKAIRGGRYRVGFMSLGLPEDVLEEARRRWRLSRETSAH